MVISQSVSFLYNAQPAGLSTERSNLESVLILDALRTWKIRDRLNNLNELIVVVVKDEVDLSKIYMERDVFIPSFGFNGIITGLKDIKDHLLQITMHEQGWHFSRRLYKIGDNLKEYNLQLASPSDFATFLQPILDSANADMPFTWLLGEDIPATADFNFDVKWKSYYEVLRQIAIESLNDLWFEGKKVFIGKKGKTIMLNSDDKIYENLTSQVSLDSYGNIVNVVGAKVSGTNVVASDSAAQTDLLYNYERIVSDNNLKDQAAVDSVVGRILTEQNSISPDVEIDIEANLVYKYDLKSGDVLQILSNTETQSVKGFYRIIDLTVTNRSSKIKVQFSKTGKFIPRISDNLDVLRAALIKIQEIELNS